jgi:hypothetical protein
VSRFAQFHTRTNRIDDIADSDLGPGVGDVTARVRNMLGTRSVRRRRYAVRAFIIIAATLLAVSFTARAEMTYTITSYPAGLADLPCGAFKKNPDGSWTQGATLIAGGALIVGLNFKNTNETRIIESKCDKK